MEYAIATQDCQTFEYIHTILDSSWCFSDTFISAIKFWEAPINMMECDFNIQCYTALGGVFPPDQIEAPSFSESYQNYGFYRKDENGPTTDCLLTTAQKLIVDKSVVVQFYNTYSTCCETGGVVASFPIENTDCKAIDSISYSQNPGTFFEVGCHRINSTIHYSDGATYDFFFDLNIFYDPSDCIENCPNTVMDFDGVDDNLLFIGVGTETDFSIGCWFKQDFENGGNEDRIIGFGASPRLEIGINQSGELWLYDENFSFQPKQFDFVQDGEWHHVAFVAQGNSRAVYLDFVGIDEYTSGSTIYGPNLRIGSWAPGPTSGTPYIGRLDDIRGYDIPIQKEDIFDRFAAPVMDLDSNLMIHLDFEEGIPNGDNSGLTEVINKGALINGVLENFEQIGDASNFVCDTLFDCSFELIACLTDYNVISGEVGEFDFLLDNNITYTWTVNDSLISTSSTSQFVFEDLAIDYKICLEISDGSCTSLKCDTISELESLGSLNFEFCPEEIVISGCSQSIDFGELNATWDLSEEAHVCFSYPFLETECIRSDDLSMSDVFPLGITSIQCTATAPNGLSDTCQWLVEIADQEPPECPEFTMDFYLDESGIGVNSTSSILDVAFDACSEVELVSEPVDIFQDCTNLLAASGTLIVIQDQAGNSNTCVVNFNVLDTIPPSCSLQDTTIIMPPSGQFTLDPGGFSQYASDNCGVDSLSVSNTQYTCADLGTSSIFLYAYDSSDNECISAAQMTIVDPDGICDCFDDNTPPNCNTDVIDVYLNFAGQAEFNSNQVLNFATDDCNEVILSEDPEVIQVDCNSDLVAEVGIQDSEANETTCFVFLNPIDTIKPLCGKSIVSVDLRDQLNYTIEFNSEVQHFDNCEFVTTDASFTVDCFTDPFDLIYEYDISDGSGNTQNCQTVIDLQFNSQVDFTYEQSTCYNVAFFEVSNVHFTDETEFAWTLDGEVFSNERNPSTQFQTISGEVCVTLTNGFCQTTSCRFIILNEENPPVITGCQDIQLTASLSSCDAVLENLNIDATSLCTPDVQINFERQDGLTMESPFALGNTQVNVTAEDQYGVQSTCQFIVNVIDESSPICSMEDIVTNALPGQDGLDVMFDISGISDCSPVQILSCTHQSGDFFECGSTLVSCELVDDEGNEGTCSFNVIVNCICETTFTYLQDDACYDVFANASASGYENEPQFTWLLNDLPIAEGSTFAYTPSTLNDDILCVQTTDGDCSNIHCEQIILEPSVPPQFENCIDITVFSEEFTCENTSFSAEVTAFSPCELEIESFGVFRADKFDLDNPWPIGTTTVNAFAQDTFGQSNNCSFTVTVIDNVPPVCVTQDITVSLDQNGFYAIDVDALVGNSNDNCGIQNSFIELESLTCQDLGDNAVSITLSDGVNTSTCSAQVTVLDTTEPTCELSDITVYLDEDGNASIELSQIGYTVNDNCAITSEQLSRTEFTCADIGQSEFSLGVEDNSSNLNSCSALVIVLDTIPPPCLSGIIQNVSLNDGEGELTQTNWSQVYQDICSEVEVVISQTSFSCEDIGSNQVPLTITDDYGNVNNCFMTVNVLDEEAPECFVDDQIVEATSSQGAMVNYIYEAFDACGDVSVEFDLDNNTMYACGEYPVQMIVTDQNQNQTLCEFNLSVIDCQACCISNSEFNTATAEPFEIESNFELDDCQVILTFPQLSDCQYATAIDWGDNTFSDFMISSDNMVEHIYNEVDSFNICITYEEMNDTASCFISTQCESIYISSDCTVTRGDGSLNVLPGLVPIPNPFTQSIELAVQKTDEKIKTLSIYDYSGHRVYSEKVISMDTYIWDLSFMTSGVYVIKVQLTDGTILHQKITKL